MSKINKWKKFLRYQKNPGWCGPAVVQMVLLSCGISKYQATIAKAIYKKWWGTGHNLLIAYLSHYFKIVNYKVGSTISDINKHLKNGNIVIVNWWDDLGEGDADGHYSIVIDYDSKVKKITFLDPSNMRKGIWSLSADEFNSRWYDYLDIHGRTWVDGWMLWINPKSKLN